MEAPLTSHFCDMGYLIWAMTDARSSDGVRRRDDPDVRDEMDPLSECVHGVLRSLELGDC